MAKKKKDGLPPVPKGSAGKSSKFMVGGKGSAARTQSKRQKMNAQSKVKSSRSGVKYQNTKKKASAPKKSGMRGPASKRRTTR